VSTNLAPVPSESATCAHCGAPLVADQRYCLSCGQPCSPVRLAFLDVLESERQQVGGVIAAAPTVAYSPYVEPTAGPAWMRRYAPLFGVLSVLLLAGIAGLLVGHWVTQSKATSSPQVVKIEGLGAVPTAAAAATPGTSTTPATTAAAKSSGSAKSAEAKEEAEAKAEEKAEEKGASKLPPPKPLSSKQEKTTGKTKEAEVTHITQAPIEVK
jgi:hypothetical protein